MWCSCPHALAPAEIVGIAYDSGGVTTSTVTVPLVAALGCRPRPLDPRTQPDRRRLRPDRLRQSDADDVRAVVRHCQRLARAAVEVDILTLTLATAWQHRPGPGADRRRPAGLPARRPAPAAAQPAADRHWHRVCLHRHDAVSGRTGRGAVSDRPDHGNAVAEAAAAGGAIGAGVAISTGATISASTCSPRRSASPRPSPSRR